MKCVPAKRNEVDPEKMNLQPEVRWALASLSLSLLLSSLATSSANVSLPTLTQVFSASFQQVQWVVLAYLLAITSLIVSVGRLGDLTGRRRLLLAGISLFTVASFLCAVATTLSMLIAARMAQGLGAAVMMALTMAFAREIMPGANIGSAMGLLGTMSAIGTALGPSFGGLLIASVGWPSIFFINVPLGALALFLVLRFLPLDQSRWRTNHTGFDATGTILLAFTLAAYALAVTAGHGRFGLLNVSLMIVAAVGLGFFLLVETRAASPLLPLEMFRNPILTAGFAMSSLVTTVMMATLVVGPFYLAGALSLDATRVGLVMSTGPIVSAVGGIPAGRLVDRLGGHGMTVVGLVTMVFGCSVIILSPMGLGISGYIVPLLFITAGYALFQAANNTAVMTTVPSSQSGVISGLLNLARNLGLMTGASVMGSVFAFGVGTNNITTAPPDAIASGMRSTFTIATVLLVNALVIAVSIYRRTMTGNQVTVVELKRSMTGKGQPKRSSPAVCPADLEPAWRQATDVRSSR